MRTTSLLLLTAWLLAACASAPVVAPPADHLFADRLFGPPRERVTTEDVFTATDAMRRFLAVDIADQLRTQGLQKGLFEALYRKAQLKLDYDAATTKTAAQAFESRSGNCLALVIMTASLAKELKLNVSYQSAYLEETWARDGDLILASGHVNVVVGRRVADAMTRSELSPLTIDFLPPEEIRRLRTRDITEATILAMFANNRAAEALTKGMLDDAYAWSREALRNDPSFLAAYNTLGVIYLRHGAAGPAARVFEHILGSEPHHTRALSNLAVSYDRLGRTADAGRVRTTLASLEPYPPFHHFNLGMAAMRVGDYRAARDHFAREVERAGYYHEFQYWLAVAQQQLGETAEARKHLRLAMERSPAREQHDRYAAKLEQLRAHQ